MSLTLEAGELVAVVGRSGSGKTTLLSLFGGWERAAAGEIEWQGRTCDPAELRWTQVSTVPQVPGLLEELTVRENIALPLLVGSGASWDDALYGSAPAALLERLNLAQLADRPPEETSLGEQQRCSIARALVCAPQLILADEPTAHQDARMLSQVVDALAGAAAEGVVLRGGHAQPRGHRPGQPGDRDGPLGGGLRDERCPWPGAVARRAASNWARCSQPCRAGMPRQRSTKFPTEKGLGAGRTSDARPGPRSSRLRLRLSRH